MVDLSKKMRPGEAEAVAELCMVGVDLKDALEIVDLVYAPIAEAYSALAHESWREKMFKLKLKEFNTA